MQSTGFASRSASALIEILSRKRAARHYPLTFRPQAFHEHGKGWQLAQDREAAEEADRRRIYAETPAIDEWSRQAERRARRAAAKLAAAKAGAGRGAWRHFYAATAPA